MRMKWVLVGRGSSAPVSKVIEHEEQMNVKVATVSARAFPT